MDHPSAVWTPPSWQSARFLTSAPSLAQCPPDFGAEIAFAGRSNAGKSSAINAITRNKQLARASRTPGRTRLINFFSLNNPECRLVDLPGYGYAKVSKVMQKEWQRDLHAYLEARQSLRALILVADVRQALAELDAQLVAWCNACGLPAMILLTKADKLSRNQARAIEARIRKELQQFDVPFATALFSAPKREGIEAVENYMAARMADALNGPDAEAGDAASLNADSALASESD